jgi:hypothetical protein
LAIGEEGLQWIQPNYVFATPVLGGQATVGLGAFFGHNDTDPDGTLTATLGPIVAERKFNVDSSVTGFGDLYPIGMVQWHHDVNNYMVYATGDIPVGDYDPKRLANLGIGHGAIDGGVGYTYLNPRIGYEFSIVTGVPVGNQIRTYWWCNPPKIGRGRMRPMVWVVRDTGASLFSDRCVRA